MRVYPTASRSAIAEEHRITASVLGKTLTVCPLRALPNLRENLRENVLLDIDVDYLVVPRVSGKAGRHSPLPWSWPADLLSWATNPEQKSNGEITNRNH